MGGGLEKEPGKTGLVREARSQSATPTISPGKRTLAEVVRRSTAFHWLVATSCALTACCYLLADCAYPELTTVCGDQLCGPNKVCAPNQPICVDVGGCGDGIIEKGEVCDDGNILDGEVNDAGVLALDKCSHDCKSDQTCGNGIVDPGEACDDGNIVDGEVNDAGVFALDKCSHDCKSDQTCGNGVVDPGEMCDHGDHNGTPNGGCDSHCRLISFVCGNGVIDQNQGEQCDPGPVDSASCNSPAAGSVACQLARCGDGYTNFATREQCDTNGFDTAMCNGLLCTLPVCGDNYINNAAGEQCESGGQNSQTCNGRTAGAVSCHLARCGDGYINAAAGEQCEGNADCTGGNLCKSCVCSF